MYCTVLYVCTKSIILTDPARGGRGALQCPAPHPLNAGIPGAGRAGGRGCAGVDLDLTATSFNN